MAGRSSLVVTAEQKAALQDLSQSDVRGEADRARATLLTLEGWTSPQVAQGHCQLVGLRSRRGATRTARPWLRRSGDASDLGPNLIGLGSGGSILGGWNSGTVEQEEVVDPVMRGQEALCLPKQPYLACHTDAAFGVPC